MKNKDKKIDDILWQMAKNRLQPLIDRATKPRPILEAVMKRKPSWGKK